MRKMYKLFLRTFILAFLGSFFNVAVVQAEPIYAYIELVEGAVSIVDTKGQARIPHVNDVIEVGETVVIGRNGELQARTEDHGYVSFRANTKVKIESYLAVGGKEDNAVVSLLYGTLRSITGWIGKSNPSQYAIKTPNATLGIRGTDHEPLVILPPAAGEAAAAPHGTYEKVNEGATVLKNAAGQTVVNANEAAFSPHDAKSAPKKLERIPEIYKKTVNEARIDARSKELAKEVEEKRLQKQKEVKAKKEEAHKRSTTEKKHRSPTEK